MCTKFSIKQAQLGLSSIVALGNSASLSFFLLLSKMKYLLSQPTGGGKDSVKENVLSSISMCILLNKYFSSSLAGHRVLAMGPDIYSLGHVCIFVSVNVKIREL